MKKTLPEGKHVDTQLQYHYRLFHFIMLFLDASYKLLTKLMPLYVAQYQYTQQIENHWDRATEKDAYILLFGLRNYQ